jgi:hypothetical protein
VKLRLALLSTPLVGLAVAGLVLAAGAASGRRVVVDAGGPHHPPVSSALLYSHGAQVNHLGHADPSGGGTTGSQPPSGAAKTLPPPGATQANQDWNARPQDEPSIALNPSDPTKWVVAANDYGVGDPIGTGVYSSDAVNYFPPFPLLAATDGTNQIVEPPLGTGDPNIVYSNHAHAYILGSIGFSGSFCENGVFVYRSTDGKNWTRPTVPDLGNPQGTVTYWDKQNDCSVEFDKDGVAVDNTGGPHDGRIYLTWTQFMFDTDGNFLSGPEMMAYSDDDGDTFSKPIDMGGKSHQLCPNQTSGPKDMCDEDGFSTPTVLANGKLAFAFQNYQGAGYDTVASQYLVTIWDPGSKKLSGPFKVADLVDGVNDLPINSDGVQTLCNANFRYGSQGNIVGGRNGTMYLTYSDDAKKAGQFPSPTSVAASPPYACPGGKQTDTDVYIWKSTDGGQHWTNVTPNAAKTSKDQFYPWVAADNAGHVSVVFYDRSSDPSNHDATTVLVQSSNDGTSWPKTTTVSSFASNFDNSFFDFGAFIGDYNGDVIDQNGASHPVWTGVTPGKDDSDIFMKTVAP